MYLSSIVVNKSGSQICMGKNCHLGFRKVMTRDRTIFFDAALPSETAQ